MLAKVPEALRDALAVAFPVSCAGCGIPDRVLCIGCLAALRPSERRHTLDDGTVVTSALRYDGVVRAAILNFKERGRTDLTSVLARALRVAIETAAAESTASIEVCPIPSTRAAVRRRGYRPVDELVKRCGLRTSRVLALTATTTQQKLLGRTGREHNLHGSFRARSPLQGRRFLIVDDIVTTGATLAEAARAIRAHGGEVVAAATLAFTPKRVPTSARL